MKRNLRIFLFVAACLVFASTWSHGFLYDDVFRIQTNPAIWKPLSIQEIFSKPSWPGDLYRPTGLLSYRFTYELVKLEPFLYHATNIVLHGLVTVLLFQLLANLFELRLAFLTALLFGVHPIHTEVVASISNRTELLCHLFGLVAANLCLYLGAFTAKPLRRFIQWAAIGLLTFLACCSKENGAVYLLLVPLCLVTKYGLRDGFRRSILPVNAMLCGLVVYVFMRQSVVPTYITGGLVKHVTPLDNPLIAMSLIKQVLGALALLGKYLWLSLMPYPLSADYSFAHLLPRVSWEFANYLITTFAAFGALFFAVHKGLTRVAFFIAWFFLSFAVTSNVPFLIGTIFADRIAYLGSAGVSGLLVLGMLNLEELFNRKNLAIIFTCIVVIAYAFRTQTESSYWASNKVLFETQIKRSPKSARTQLNWGSMLHKDGDHDRAIAHLERSLEINGNEPRAAWAIGLIFSDKQDLRSAEHWFRRALDIKVTYVPALSSMGRLMFHQGKLVRARRYFEFSLKQNPHHYGTLVGLMAVSIEENDFRTANQLKTKLYRMDPYNQELSKLTAILLKREQVW